MARIGIVILAVIGLSLIDFGSTTYVPAPEWNEYKMVFDKKYDSLVAEANAQYYYAYNKQWISNQNSLFDRGQRSFKLKINQFTDMRAIQFNALFPKATSTEPSNASPAPAVNSPPATYDPKSFGFSSTIQNQGTNCNSGWAYTAAKAIEILKAMQTGTYNPAPLSAQNLIDCAGRSTGCKTQVPQAAFDYMTKYKMDLLAESAYKNNNSLSEPGMCLAKGVSAAKLDKYSTIKDGDDESLKKYVGAGFPVIVEFNPTSFEFMHYAEGVFQPPATQTGSHFMVVTGYDTDAVTGKNYWLLQNSFDTAWGERGFIRIERSDTVKLAKNAIFPIELA